MTLERLDSGAGNFLKQFSSKNQSRPTFSHAFKFKQIVSNMSFINKSSDYVGK